MKTSKIFLSGVAITGLCLLSTSCSKDFYTKVNNNPNQPTVVPPNTMLPGVEVALAYEQGGDAARYASVFDQQGFGAAREASAYEAYSISGSNLPEQLWDNVYATVMENDYSLIKLATTNSYNRYAGIANILMAYSLQCTVDFWGDVPYSQAFLGAANINPAYDKDQTLYANAISLLNTGIADLNNPSPGAIIPSTDDVIYGGNVASWLAFANAIKARLYIHQCKHSNAAMCDSALNCATRALADGFTNAQVVFQGTPNSNPMFQYVQGWGDISYVTAGGADNTLYDTMVAAKDPRVTVFFDTAGAAAAAAPIVGVDSKTYYGAPTSPVEFITKEELDFIQAEATLRSGGTVVAASVFYVQAINDNFTKLGIGASATAYAAANPLPVTTAGAQYQIGKQEWIALFNNPEEWTTWRRTGAPALQPYALAATLEIPRRMVLPNSELTENANAPKNPPPTLYTPAIFWDN